MLIIRKTHQRSRKFSSRKGVTSKITIESTEPYLGQESTIMLKIYGQRNPKLSKISLPTKKPISMRLWLCVKRRKGQHPANIN